MRQVFRDGGDMHTLNAEDFIGASLETLPEDEREIARNKAKRIGFGTLYGSGPRGLVASAWSMYRIEMSEAEAQAWKDRFYARYPRLRQWQNETANVARVTGTLRSVVGRPLRAEWEPVQPLKWTLCCNYPVQSSAADVMLLAMARVHAALEGLDARLLLQIHDELVCRVRRGQRAPGRGAARGADDRRLARDLPGRAGARDRRSEDPPVLGETAEEGVSDGRLPDALDASTLAPRRHAVATGASSSSAGRLPSATA